MFVFSAGAKGRTDGQLEMITTTITTCDDDKKCVAAADDDGTIAIRTYHKKWYKQPEDSLGDRSTRQERNKLESMPCG